ncbi:hypothetical protein INT45_005625 [Circinella minor]|uniref:Uncharacterized protein n=1 Tax=Circinella minor TaxID=1195481 RepID=A0A8H7VJQ8_9FUNG|nr:hypothetical protein INT45_005625 [Circinella minor]
MKKIWKEDSDIPTSPWIDSLKEIFILQEEHPRFTIVCSLLTEQVLIAACSSKLQTILDPYAHLFNTNVTFSVFEKGYYLCTSMIFCERLQQNKYFPQLQEAGSKVAIVVLHSYGHSMSCQSRHNPRYLDNFVGMADGESCERVRSFLGRFVSLCGQMSPEGRMITITHAIKHYNKKHIYTLPNTIKRRFNKANLTIRHANKVIKAYNPSLTDDLLQEKWLQFVEEVTVVPSPDSQSTINGLKRQQQQRNIVADLEARLIGNQVITERWGLW